MLHLNVSGNSVADFGVVNPAVSDGARQRAMKTREGVLRKGHSCGAKEKKRNAEGAREEHDADHQSKPIAEPLQAARIGIECGHV